MLTGPMRAQSNRSDWRFSFELVDTDTDDTVDLTGATIKIAVRATDSALPILAGTSSDGHITVATPTNGIFAVAFSALEMSVLNAGTYDVGITALLNTGITYQLAAMTLPVVDGVVQ